MTNDSSIYLSQARAAFDDAPSNPQRALLLGRDLSLALTPADGVAWLYARLAVAIASATIEEFGVAAEAADDVITIATSLGEHTAKRTALRVLSSCQRAEGRWRLADRTLRTTLDLARASADARGLVDASVLRGQMYQALGSVVVASTLFADSARVADRETDLPAHIAASAHINAARCAWLLRDNTRTEDHLRRASAHLTGDTRGAFHVYHDALRCCLDRRQGRPVDIDELVDLLNEARAQGLAPIVVELDAEVALHERAFDALDRLLECVQRWRSRRDFPMALDLLRTLDEAVPSSDTLARSAVDRERTATVLHAVRARGAALESSDERPVFARATPPERPAIRAMLDAKAMLFQLKREVNAVADTMAAQLGWPDSSEYGCMPASDDFESLLDAANGPCLAASLRRDVERLGRMHDALGQSECIPQRSDIGRRLANLDRLVGTDPARALEECNALDHSLDAHDQSANAELAYLRVEALFALESWQALADALHLALDAQPTARITQRLRTIQIAFDNLKAVSQGTVRAATQKLAEARAVGRTHDAVTVLRSLAIACDQVALRASSASLRTRAVEMAELCDDPAVHRVGALVACELALAADPQAGYRWLGRANALLALAPSPFYAARVEVTEHALTLLQSPNQDAVEHLQQLRLDAVRRGWVSVLRAADTSLGHAGQLDHDRMMRLCDDLSRSGQAREAAELALHQAELAGAIGLDRESRALSQLSYRLASTVEANQLQVAALRGEELRGFPDLLPLPIAEQAGSELPLSSGLARIDDILATIARAAGCERDPAFARAGSPGGGFGSAFGSAEPDSERVMKTAAKVRVVLEAIGRSAANTPMSHTASHAAVPDVTEPEQG